MIASISILVLVCCSISVRSHRFLRTRLSYERKHPSIPYLTTRAQKNYDCVMGMTMSDSDKFLMAESSIWWFVLSDSTNALCAWELFMRFQVWINRLDTPPGTKSEGRHHDPRAICFTLDICKYA